MSREEIQVDLAAVAASNALSSALGYFPVAAKRNRELEPIFRSYTDKTNRAKVVVNLIQNDKALHTSSVVASIRMIQSLGEALAKDLGSSTDMKTIGSVMAKLDKARKSTVLQICYASVGLENINGRITIDTKLVNKTNIKVIKELGDKAYLQITKFLAGLNHAVDATGKIKLTDNDYEKWTTQQLEAAHPEVNNLGPDEKSRIICNCLARGQSIQVLGPVAVDLWEDIAFIKTDGCVSMDQAVQFGYAVTMEVYQETLDRQERRIALHATKGRN